MLFYDLTSGMEDGSREAVEIVDGGTCPECPGRMEFMKVYRALRCIRNSRVEASWLDIYATCKKCGKVWTSEENLLVEVSELAKPNSP